MSFWSKLFGKKKQEKKVEEVKPEVKEEPVVEEAPVEEPVVEEAPVEEPVVEEAPVEEPVVEEAPVEESEEVYEVRVHLQEGWQVIKQGGKRATRRFPTQAECVLYCKDNGLKHIVYKKTEV